MKRMTELCMRPSLRKPQFWATDPKARFLICSCKGLAFSNFCFLEGVWDSAVRVFIGKASQIIPCLALQEKVFSFSQAATEWFGAVYLTVYGLDPLCGRSASKAPLEFLQIIYIYIYLYQLQNSTGSLQINNKTPDFMPYLARILKTSFCGV